MSKQEALSKIEDLLVSIEQQGEELKELFRENFPDLYEQGKAYDVFNLTGSWNRYDTTVDTLFEAAGEYEEEYAE
jgi:hypothetical protein